MVLKSMRAAVGIQTCNSITMMVTAIDSNPPFPPEHTPCVTFAPSDNCDKNESNLFNDYFILDDEHPGTGSYGATAIVDFNCHTKNHHDPPNPSLIN